MFLFSEMFVVSFFQSSLDKIKFKMLNLFSFSVKCWFVATSQLFASLAASTQRVFKKR